MTEAKILVVDDVTTNLILVLRILQKAGYEAHGVGTGAEAIEVMNGNKNLKLVILDLGLPDFSGFDVMRQTQAMKKHRGYKVCILSAKGKKEDVAAAIDLGADDYILKPINSEVLVRKVKELTPADEGSKRPEDQKYSMVLSLLESDFLPDISVESIQPEGLVVTSSSAVRANKILKFNVHNWDEKNPPVSTEPLLAQVLRVKKVARGEYKLALKWLNASEAVVKKIQGLLAYSDYLRKGQAQDSQHSPGSGQAAPLAPSTK